MIYHVCPTCKKSQALTDDYVGIIVVCSSCQQLAEVEDPHDRIANTSQSAKKKDVPWYAQEIIPKSKPSHTQTDVPWSCPRCFHCAPAIIQYHGMSTAGFQLVVTPFFVFLFCVFFWQTLGPAVVLVLMGIAGLAALFLISILFSGKARMLNQYVAHCEKCGYLFR